MDAKGSFSFFHGALVGVSKDLRLFLLFPLRTVVIPPAIFKKKPTKCYFQDEEKSHLGRSTFPVLAPLEPLLSGEMNGGGFQLQPLRIHPRSSTFEALPPFISERTVLPLSRA